MSLTETTLSAKFSAVGKGKITKSVGYFAAFIGLGLAEAALGRTLPGLAEHTRTALSEISFLFVARAGGYLLGALLAGRLYDRLPGHWVMAGVLVMMVLMLFLTPLMPLLWLLTLVLLLLGVAQSAVDVGGNTLLVWVHRRQVGPYMNALHFFFGVGAFLSPVIIAQAIWLSGDITWAYWLLALLIAPVAVYVLLLPSPRSEAADHDGRVGPVNYLWLTLLALFFFFFVGAEISFGGWIYSYGLATGLANDTMATYLNSAFWGALTLARLLTIPLAIRLRPRHLLMIDLAGSILSVVLILLWPHSLTALWLGTLGTGFFLASIFPTAISLAERNMTVTGAVTSWFIVGASLGSMAVPWLIGQLFESVGPQVMMLNILVVLILATVIFVVLIRSLPGRRPAEPAES